MDTVLLCNAGFAEPIARLVMYGNDLAVRRLLANVGL